MEKLLNNYDKEYMKMAMLKHEETFREQVYELHRLYEIQKILMKNSAKSKQVQELCTWNFSKAAASSDPVNDPLFTHKRQRQILYLEHPDEEYGARRKCNEIVDIEDELELTLGPRGQSRKKKVVDTSDSAASFSSSSSTLSSHLKRSNSASDGRINTPPENVNSRKWSFEMPTSNAVLWKEKWF